MPVPIPETTARRAGQARMPSLPTAPSAKGAQTPRNARTREAILTAALSLYAAEGYGAVTMRGIAQRLGFSAPAIYNYFLSKEEIFANLQGIGLELMAEAVLRPETDDPLADFRSIFTNYYAFSKAYPEYFALLYVDPSAPLLTHESPALKRMEGETARRWDRCIGAGIFELNTPRDAPGIFWALVHGIAVLRRVNAVPPSAEFDQQVSAGLDLFIAGLRHGLMPPQVFPVATPTRP